MREHRLAWKEESMHLDIPTLGQFSTDAFFRISEICHRSPFRFRITTVIRH
jgi:hypothetical protein